MRLGGLAAAGGIVNHCSLASRQPSGGRQRPNQPAHKGGAAFNAAPCEKERLCIDLTAAILLETTFGRHQLES
jgi:hypothetical protein